MQLFQHFKYQPRSLFVLAGLFILALVSLLQGIANALKYSRDFQWSPIVVLWDGINPYSEVLSGNFSIRMILDQSPGYLHAMYVFLAPFALLDWEPAKIVWLVFNLVATFFICYFLGTQHQLSARMRFAIPLIFLCSTPFRNCLGNGQISILMLLCFTGLYSAKHSISAAICGLTYIKYSFAPPLATYILFARGWRVFTLSLLPALIGYGIFFFIVGGRPLDVLLQPLQVTAIASGPGLGDMMSIAAIFLRDSHPSIFIFFYYVLPLALSTYVTYFVSKRLIDVNLAIAIVATSSLLFFRHLGYDYVFLLPAFFYACSRIGDWRAKLVTGLTLFNWFGLKALDTFNPPQFVMIPINTLVLALLLLGLLQLRHSTSDSLNRFR
jgi:hypothetical protein